MPTWIKGLRNRSSLVCGDFYQAMIELCRFVQYEDLCLSSRQSHTIVFQNSIIVFVFDGSSRGYVSRVTGCLYLVSERMLTFVLPQARSDLVLFMGF